MENSLSPWCQAYLSRAKSESDDYLDMYEQIFNSNFSHYTEEES